MDLYSQEIQGKKKDLQNQSQTMKKMAIRTYMSIITLNVNGLKYSNQKTQTGRMDIKKEHILSTRNPLLT